MTEADYTQLVSALSTAASILSARREELNAADLRIRSLVSLAEKEAKRALLGSRSGRREEAESHTPVAT